METLLTESMIEFLFFSLFFWASFSGLLLGSLFRKEVIPETAGEFPLKRYAAGSE